MKFLGQDSKKFRNFDYEIAYEFSKNSECSRLNNWRKAEFPMSPRHLTFKSREIDEHPSANSGFLRVMEDLRSHGI